MSYQVIARKWRPQTFEEVTGQEVITQTLRNALEYDRLHHAYLFSGARGVGKTTTARILAKALNCHKTDKPSLTPCLLTDPTICPSCLEISESRSMDVLEIDAASHTGIGEVRETILDNINFNPARDRYRVFIIDEVHQLSKPAFNALLKTVEEPPPNVVFIMATTELHKVPETILSRCQEFEFRTIALQKIFDRLKLIADAEKIDIADDALRELARSGEGSMRDAQSNFDQVISFSSDKISSADVTNALGFAGVEVLTKTINAIAGREPHSVLAVVDDLISRGHDLRNFCRDVLATFRDLLVFKVAGNDKHLFESAVFSVDEMEKLAAAFSEADLLRFFNSFCETEASLREAAHPRYVLEIGLVKLIEMRSVATIESILERLDAFASGVPRTTTPAIAASATAHAASEKKTLTIEPPAPSAEINIEPPDDDIGFYEPPSESRPVTTNAVSTPVIPQSFRLPYLSSEELEHVDDQRLDDEFENRLLLSGDDLLRINGADKFFALETSRAVPVPMNGNSAAGAKPALETPPIRHDPVPNVEAAELPTLADNPTETELRDFAGAYPSVRAAMRVFRAKIVEVKKI